MVAQLAGKAPGIHGVLAHDRQVVEGAVRQHDPPAGRSQFLSRQTQLRDRHYLVFDGEAALRRRQRRDFAGRRR